ncbi:MAG: hypothetical protein VXZ18_19275, partial [Pseudomonadota bacterium]|nr:hypothetical protein [Pseudomonadota bacterium]
KTQLKFHVEKCLASAANNDDVDNGNDNTSRDKKEMKNDKAETGSAHQSLVKIQSKQTTTTTNNNNNNNNNNSSSRLKLKKGSKTSLGVQSLNHRKRKDLFAPSASLSAFISSSSSVVAPQRNNAAESSLRARRCRLETSIVHCAAVLMHKLASSDEKTGEQSDPSIGRDTSREVRGLLLASALASASTPFPFA